MSGKAGVTHRDRLIIDRNYFLDRVEVDSKGCWLWKLHINPRGYGEASKGHKRVRAHRLAYETLVGEITMGLTIDHLCRVTYCVNPDHLEPVTIQENIRRATINGSYKKERILI